MRWLLLVALVACSKPGTDQRILAAIVERYEKGAHTTSSSSRWLSRDSEVTPDGETLA